MLKSFKILKYRGSDGHVDEDDRIVGVPQLRLDLIPCGHCGECDLYLFNIDINFKNYNRAFIF